MTDTTTQQQVSNFKPFPAQHCETAATGSLLRHLGIELSEPMLFGLGQGFGFIYWKMSFMNLPFIGGRSKPVEITRTFCHNFGLTLDERETSSSRRAWENVAQMIDQGVPVGLQLDCYHLEHFAHSFHFAGHFLSVYGYNDHHVQVFDTGKTYLVSRENLEKARFEKGSMAAKARSYTVSGRADLSSIPALIPHALHQMASEFLNPPIKNFGYRGIEKLGAHITTWLETCEDPNKELNDQAELMEHGGTGGAIFRRFFRDFLRESLDHLPGNSRIKEAAALYHTAGENWTEVAHLVKKAGDSSTQAPLEAASRICKETAAIEKQAMLLLAQA